MASVKSCEVTNQLTNLVERNIHCDVREDAASLSKIFEYDAEVPRLLVEQCAEEDWCFEGHVGTNFTVETNFRLVHHARCMGNVEHGL